MSLNKRGRRPLSLAYQTTFGSAYLGKVEEILSSKHMEQYKGRVNLIFTSPPFPLNRKKKYGNLQGEEYVKWLAQVGSLLKDYLAADGSIVIELGNSWVSGEPTMSTLALEALLKFKTKNEFHLCQEFIWNNPAKLPTPAQWVNIERIRVKDSYTRLWWLSKITRPKASNKNILKEYSPSMKNLLKTKKYNAGMRPSEHHIGERSFLNDHGGAIPSNVITLANTRAADSYQKYCKSIGLIPHPARMPIGLAEFFIKFLTEPNDLVLDPFGGSNTTGSAAEGLGRKWLITEASSDYLRGSVGRFDTYKFGPAFKPGK